MYDSYFGFSKPPFENNLDPEFLFLSKGHQEVLASLVYFIKTGKGFALLCGDVGTGKTMLVNCFLASLSPSVQATTVSNPFASSLDILKRVAQALNLDADNGNLLELSDQVKDALLASRNQGRQFLLVVDEAHLLSDMSLEGIRVLSNLETSQRKLLQILLVGQHELSHRLNRPEMRPLRQRLNVNRYLTPLSSQETWQYIDHRLKMVGSSFENCFDIHCRVPIFRATQGMPRSINQICDSALLVCMAEGLKTVDRRILKKAQEAVQTDSLAVPPVPRRAIRLKSRSKAWGAAVSALALVAMGAFGYKHFSNDTITTGYGTSPLALSVPAPVPPSPRMVTPEKETDTLVKASVPDDQLQTHPDPGKPPLASQKTDIPEDRAQTDLTNQERPAISSIDHPVPAPASVSAPASPPASATAQAPAPLATCVAVQKGESLSAIALRHYGNCRLGLLAILLANREKIRDELVYPGQELYLPAIDNNRQAVCLQDGSCYAPYAWIYSSVRLKEITSWLKKKRIRFLVIHSRDNAGKGFQRIVLGGYQSPQDLQQAVDKTKTRG